MFEGELDRLPGSQLTFEGEQRRHPWSGGLSNIPADSSMILIEFMNDNLCSRVEDGSASVSVSSYPRSGALCCGCCALFNSRVFYILYMLVMMHLRWRVAAIGLILHWVMWFLVWI